MLRDIGVYGIKFLLTNQNMRTHAETPDDKSTLVQNNSFCLFDGDGITEKRCCGLMCAHLFSNGVAGVMQTSARKVQQALVRTNASDPLLNHLRNTTPRA